MCLLVKISHSGLGKSLLFYVFRYFLLKNRFTLKSTVKTGPAVQHGIIKSSEIIFKILPDWFEGEIEESKLRIKFKSQSGTKTENFILPAVEFQVKNLEEKMNYEISYMVIYTESDAVRKTDEIYLGKG